ncbi:DUF4134 family protein [Dyadobacter jejuensis]|uniref:DUF4134 family protein n=1 Tax=Dyadobacter jejuensis TaxID=1082580 RepID=UPI001304A72B|nr:DUF4134 family protein [Dyadobacter jejuensis]
MIDIRNSSTSDGYINRFVTIPLSENLSVVVGFVYSVLAILSLITAYRIYIKWHSGESEDIISDLSKWMLGMLLCLSLIAGLKQWLLLDPVPASGVEFKLD